jgi:predicted DNA-binding ribbon-helix-helix protein
MSATRGSFARSGIRKRSIVIGGHKTSVSLEDEFWASFCEIAKVQGKAIGDLVGEIKASSDGSLSSAMRLFVLAHFRGRQPGTV